MGSEFNDVYGACIGCSGSALPGVDQYALFQGGSMNVSLREKLSFACVSTLGPQSRTKLSFMALTPLIGTCHRFISLREASTWETGSSGRYPPDAV